MYLYAARAGITLILRGRIWYMPLQFLPPALFSPLDQLYRVPPLAGMVQRASEGGWVRRARLLVAAFLTLVLLVAAPASVSLAA